VQVGTALEGRDVVRLDPDRPPLGFISTSEVSRDLGTCVEEPAACFTIRGPSFETRFGGSAPSRHDAGGLQAQQLHLTWSNNQRQPYVIDDTEIVWAKPDALVPADRRPDGSCGELSLCFPPTEKSEQYEHCSALLPIELADEEEPATEPAPTPTTAPQPPTATPQPTVTPTPTPEPTPTCPDADGDGICNAEDNCRDMANADQADVDADNKGNACDICTDTDLDLHCAEADDTCPDDYDTSLLDTENDGVGDACDNCPFDTNPDQADSDGNGIGNRCDGGDGGTPIPGETPSPGPCPAGQEEDFAGTGRCYPICSLGVMTSGGFCCPASPLDTQVIAALGCSPVCGRGLIADFNPATRRCVTDPRDPTGRSTTRSTADKVSCSYS